MRSWVLVLGSIGLVAACQRAPEDLGMPQRKEPVRSAPENSGAERVRPAPATPCAISYEQTKAALSAGAALQQAPAPAGEKPPRIELVSREQYLEDCEKLPPGVQECLVFDYARQNEAECTRARAEYDELRTVRPTAAR